MKKIEKLAELINEIEALMNVCTRCGSCQSVCSVYGQTCDEADSARGKIVLLKALGKKIFQNPKKVQKRLDCCLLCGSCGFLCPNGVDIFEIFLKARVILAEFTGLSAGKKILLRQILAKNNVFDHVCDLGSKYQNILLKHADNDLNTSCSRSFSPLPKNRYFVDIAETSFKKRVELKKSYKSYKSYKTDSKRVLFFVGCLTDKLYPDIGDAVLKVLNYHGFNVIIPEEQGCCGMPSIAGGDLYSFQKLVKHNIDIIKKEKFDYIVSACPTCIFAIKKIWSLFFEADKKLKEDIKQIGEKIIDINEFIVKKTVSDFPDEKKAKENIIKMTYHDPCHLKKSLNVVNEPRILIKQNKKYDFIEMEDSDRCCGMGGSFSITHYNISEKIAEKKIENIKKTKAKVVSTACPACMMQLSDALSKIEDKIKVKHSIEIYADSLKESVVSG